MSNQFISPNWHPLLIHYPIAFLSAGILIELFSFLWPRGFFRAAGRWMIVLGALATLPSLALGLYAFRTAVGGHGPWHTAIQQSTWAAEQWRFMRMHILLNSIGSAAVVVGVVAWVGASDLWRRRLYLPVLLVLLCGMGLFGVGSWYGGESVYRYGTAVALTPNQTQGAPAATVDQANSEHKVEHSPVTHDVKWYVPPLELHLFLAGLVVALAMGAVALTLRRLEPPEAKTEPAETIGPTDRTVVADAALEPIPVSEVPVARSETPTLLPDPERPTTIPDVVSTTEAPTFRGPYPIQPPVIHAGRFWMLMFLLALCTALVGLWSVVDYFTPERFNRNWSELTHPGNTYRLVLHTIFGALLILLPLILALVARFGRRRRGLAYVFIALVVLAAGMQVWLGIALFYDGQKGPVFHFTPPAAVQ
ncbi:MAG TPA: DUF2231 domain-containing protein [Tepidisphaeraceae bacterium]|nr:DUF2231 domain-containing protein [Tepidisphaeraceae bacterium]